MQMSRKAAQVIIIITILTVAAIICIFNKPETDLAKPEKIHSIELKKISEIQQPQDYFVAKPRKMLGYKNKIYILDQKFSMILVFKETGLSHTIGGPGIGPGEFQNANSFDISKNRLYVLNQASKVEVFDISGDYIHTFKLEKPAPFAAPSDIKVHENHIYIGYNLGETKVQKYGLKGNFLDNFIKGGRPLDPGRFVLANPISIFVYPARNSLILFNKFKGDLEIYNLSSGVLENSIENKDPIVKKRISNLTENISNQNFEEYSKEIKSIFMWRCSFDDANNKVVIIPSQSSIDQKMRNENIYSFDLNLETLSMARFVVKSKKLIIKDCCSIQGKYVILDYNLNLFLGG